MPENNSNNNNQTENINAVNYNPNRPQAKRQVNYRSNTESSTIEPPKENKVSNNQKKDSFISNSPTKNNEQKFNQPEQISNDKPTTESNKNDSIETRDNTLNPLKALKQNLKGRKNQNEHTKSNFRRNNSFNQNINTNEEESLNDDKNNENNENQDNEENNQNNENINNSENQENENIQSSSPTLPPLTNTNDNDNNKDNNEQKDLITDVYKKFIKYNKYKIAIIGGIIFLFLIILFALMGASVDTSELSANLSGCSSEFWWPIGVGEPTSSGVYTEEPVNYTRISSPFGPRSLGYHYGVDIPAPTGTPIVAALDGTVTYSNVMGTCGNAIEITHSNGIITRYCHASKLISKVNDVVAQGTKIAEVGSTGRSTGPHLHFGVKVNGEFVNPLDTYIKVDNLRPQCNVRDNNIDDGILSLTTPTLTKSEFVNKMENYCMTSKNKNFCNNFSSRASSLYDWGQKYNVNPELVVVTAGREAGWKPCSSGNYNMWGLGISNGKGCSAHVIRSIEQGFKELGELYQEYTTGSSATLINNRYKERLAAGCDEGGYGPPGSFLGMLSIYGWLGTYRANPGSYGSGGCVYLKIIYGSNYSLCGPSNKCASVNGGPGCQKTTVCEQSDYTKYSAKITLNIWNNVFGG